MRRPFPSLPLRRQNVGDVKRVLLTIRRRPAASSLGPQGLKTASLRIPLLLLPTMTDQPTDSSYSRCVYVPARQEKRPPGISKRGRWLLRRVAPMVAWKCSLINFRVDRPNRLSLYIYHDQRDTRSFHCEWEKWLQKYTTPEPATVKTMLITKSQDFGRKKNLQVASFISGDVSTDDHQNFCLATTTGGLREKWRRLHTIFVNLHLTWKYTNLQQPRHYLFTVLSLHWS